MKTNIALTKCFVCGKDDVILIATKYKKNGEPVQDMEQFNGKAISKEPCNECKRLLEQGIIFISISDDNQDIDNPFRTGGWAVVKREAVETILPGTDLNKHKIFFLVDSAWIDLGLPLSDYQKELIKTKDLENSTNEKNSRIEELKQSQTGKDKSINNLNR